MQYGVPIVATDLPVFNEYGISSIVQTVSADKFSLIKAISIISANYKEISKK